MKTICNSTAYFTVQYVSMKKMFSSHPTDHHALVFSNCPIHTGLALFVYLVVQKVFVRTNSWS